MHTIGVISPVVSEIRLVDIQAQIDARSQTLGPGDRLAVLAFDAAHHPRETFITLTQKWAARCWQLALSCPKCGKACRVLRALDGPFLCGTCLPSAGRRQRLKGTKHWTKNSGLIAERLMRCSETELITIQEALLRATDERA